MTKSKREKNRPNYGNASALARRNHGIASAPPPASASPLAGQNHINTSAFDSALAGDFVSEFVSASSTSAAADPALAGDSVSELVSASSTSALISASPTSARSLWQVDEKALIQILSNLPVKTLLRLICVSKKWGRLILSPKFAFRHVSRSPCSLIIHSQKIKFVYRDTPSLESRALPHIEPIDRALPCHQPPTGHIISLYTFADQEMKTRSHLKKVISYPCSDLNPFVDIELVGAAHGILLIGIYPEAQRIHFWNPMTQESLLVPSPRIGLTPQHRLVSLGLGCDSSQYEFKVIRILSCYGHVESKDQFEWFSSKSKQWKTVKADMQGFRFYNKKCDAVVNGIPYWRVVKYWDGNSKWSLVRFDLKQNTFIGEIPPDVIDYDTLITEVRGSIGMVVNGSNRDMDVWVEADDGTWHKVFKLGPALNLPIGDLGRMPLAFYGDSGIVDEVGERGNLILYDAKIKVVDQVNVGEKVNQVDDIINVGNSKKGSYSVINYKGSVVSLKPRRFAWQ